MGFAQMVRADTAERVRPETLRAKHVCFVAPQAWPVLSRDPHIPVVGGAEVQQAILARLFAANGYRVSMICLDYGQPSVARVDGVTVHKAFAPHAGVPLLRFLHPRLTSMWRALREVDADIYYCRSASIWRGWRPSSAAGTASARSTPARPTRTSCPTRRPDALRARPLALPPRPAAVDRIVAQNEYQRATCRATYGRDAVVIPSCYQPPESKHPSKAADRVLWVGTLHENKRPELLLDLAARLPQRRFVMIGGPRRRRRRVLRAHPRARPHAAEPRVQGLPAARRRSSPGSTARACWSTPPPTRACPTRSCRPGRAACPPWPPSTSARRCIRVASNVEELAAGVEDAFCGSLARRPLPRVLRAHAFAGRGARALRAGCSKQL